ncbi:hypothetical protein N8766_06475 [bacterium]|jgi:uncharacterized protein|nr:hypothetical protein [bacterium]
MKISAELREKTEHFQVALDLFVERISEDRNILAAALLGSLHESLIWGRHEIHLWLIERDGVTKRLQSDGKEERLFRTLVQEGINIHAELIPRSRFRLMAEGSSRTSFSCRFFERRQLIYSADQSIEKWFHEANQVATNDQAKELVATTAWLIHARRRAHDLLTKRSNLPLAAQHILWCAHAIACIEIILQGEVYEDLIIEKAIADRPELFQSIYVDIMNRKPTKKGLQEAIKIVDRYLADHHQQYLSPVTQYLKKTNRVTPLSEISEHFAFTQLYPWHLESVCEWLSEQGHLDKHATPFHLTKRSLTEVEEPAYFLDQ